MPQVTANLGIHDLIEIGEAYIPTRHPSSVIISFGRGTAGRLHCLLDLID
jgi:hypothetical protein